MTINKRIISIFLCVSLMLSVFVFEMPTAAAAATISPTGTVNTPDVSLREKPSSASKALAVMSAGAAVTVVENAGHGWYKVTYQAFTGYVRADYIDVLVTGLSDPGVLMIDTALMSQPDGAVTQTLTTETQLTITGTLGDWYQVTAGSVSGYLPMSSVHKKSIIPLNTSATINSSNVNLRSIPSTTGDVVTTMKHGTKVTVRSIQDHWVKVECEGKSGYVRGDFVTYSLGDGKYMTTIHPGMRGQAVSTLQVALRKRGFLHVAANGVYGKATRAAVKKFQESVYLGADGIAGVQTLLLLFGKDATKLWNNYRSEMEPQKPQQNGKVWLVDWFGGMEDIVKKHEPFEVIDVRTGISWKMSRFGGYTALWHADVDTASKRDTEKMTEAWGGELNGSRRPVWVKIGGKYYAASLMGFVHNTGPTQGNGMDGQVCLHFRGSKIHSSGHIDEAHQACIMEAFANADRLN